MKHPGNFPLGLVVGKFAPLHLGHEALVRHAAAQCDRLLVLSYTKPEFDGCGVARRRQWLQTRWPAHECLVVDDVWVRQACAARGIGAQPMPFNDAADAVHQNWLAWLLGEVLQRRPDALFCSEDYGPPTATTLSRAFGKPVTAVVFDRDRQQVPISASALRGSPELISHWTAPEVAATFVRRLALLGGESSGKTSLSAALAQALGTVWVAEYGRELWELQQGLAQADLLKVAREQIAREDRSALEAREWLVCDTSPLTTWGYSHWTFGQADPELERLAARPYDAAVLCCPDFAFVQDGTRQDDAFRRRQHLWYLERLQSGTTPWLAVAGPVDQRVAQTLAWMKGLGRRAPPP